MARIRACGKACAVSMASLLSMVTGRHAGHERTQSPGRRLRRENSLCVGQKRAPGMVEIVEMLVVTEQHGVDRRDGLGGESWSRLLLEHDSLGWVLAGDQR